MKNCNNCKYADWKKTVAGKLHPSGEGKCLYPYKVPPLPASMYWMNTETTPCGGFINRKQIWNHCVYFLLKRID